MFDLSGKTAIVTGGNGGIGLAMAEGLATAGASILLVGRNAEKTANARADLTTRFANVADFSGDVADPAVNEAMVQACIDAFGRADILVANAGINRRMRPEEFTPKIWSEIIETNLSSNLYGAQAVRPAMLAAGGGKIITIGSMLSIFGLALAAAYGASKGGVVQLTKSLAAAWAVDNIQVNCVLPGWIDTDLTRQGRIDMPELNDKVLARTPSGRWGVPADLSGIAVFLSSPASDFITGTAIPVDGGYSIQG